MCKGQNYYVLRMVRFSEKIIMNIVGPNLLTQAYPTYASSKLCKFIIFLESNSNGETRLQASKLR